MAMPEARDGPTDNEGLPEDFEFHMEVISYSGHAQEIMDREARGEPPPPGLLDRILAWLPWGS